MPNRARAVIYSLVVFIAGTLAGALSEHWLFHRQPVVIAATPPDQGEINKKHFIEQMQRELKLDDAQVRQLETILDETVQQYHDLHLFSHHIREQGLTRIRTMLTAEQRQRFDQIIKQGEKPHDARKSPSPKKPS